MSESMVGKSKLALVTGGSQGIGLALGRLLAQRGSHVWLVARQKDKLEAAVAQLEALRQSPDQQFGYVSADIADAAQAADAVAQVAQRAGVPHLLINNAGYARPGYFEQTDLEVFQVSMAVNYFGVVYMTKAVLPGMLARGSGQIVNLSSMAGILGIFGYTAYGASKFAVRGFSDALRAELKPRGLRVAVVYPPDTDTPGLAGEAPYKPPETKALAGNASVMSPDAVAKEIIAGIERNRYTIIPGFESKMIYWLSGLLGGAVYPVMDLLVTQAQRSQHKT